jgi:hypothetical protein
VSGPSTAIMSVLLTIDDSSPSTVLKVAARNPTKENGASKGELDVASKPKAEARYLSFYELHSELQADTQGPANFH